MPTRAIRTIVRGLVGRTMQEMKPSAVARRSDGAPRVLPAGVVVSGVAVVCAVGTALVPVVLPSRDVVTMAPMLAADVFATCSAFLIAFLSFGRLAQTSLVRYALLGAAMTVLGGGTLLLAVLPATEGVAVTPSGPCAITALVAALLFAAATCVPRWSLQVRRPVHVAVFATLVLLVVTEVAAHVYVGPRIAGPVSPETFGSSGDWPLPQTQVVGAVLFWVAALGAVRRTGRDGDVLMPWLAVGAVLGGFSRLHFALAGSGSSTWVLVGTAFRLGAYLLLLAGAAQEIRWHWRRSTEVAVLEERRRIARDLHDGLAQELAFIAAQSRIVVMRPPSTDRARLVASSGERALDEARRAIAALTRPLDEPLDVALAQEVEEVAGRFGADVSLALDSGVHVSPESREALLRIAREAVVNAGRHGGARSVSVRLANHDGVMLEVKDDGCGFDVTRSQGVGRLGLTSMRERAEALGGTCSISSTEGVGTTIEVWLP